MSKLEQLIQQYCPEGVEYRPLGEVCEVLTGGEAPEDAIKGNEPVGDCIYPIYSNGIGDNALWGFASTYRVSRVSVTFSSIGTIGYPTIRNCCYTPIIRLKVIYPKDDSLLNVYFIKYALETVEFEHQKSSVPNINANMIKSISIPLPPLPVQEEIVRILDTFTQLQTELQTELQKRKEQYNWYRDNLLSFKDRNDVKYYSLNELCSIVDYRGKTPHKVEDGIFLITAKNIRMGYIDYEKSKEYIAVDDYEQVMHRGKVQIGDVLITTEAPCGNIAQIDREDVALAQRVIKYRPKDASFLNSTYLKYILMGAEFQDNLYLHSTGGTVKGIKGSILHTLTIPVPSLAEQQKIVDILDRFDTLTNDLTAGLPAEIEKRRQQYEYYRDKLLTFRQK